MLASNKIKIDVTFFKTNISKHDPYALEYASDELQNTRKIVMEAVKTCGIVLEFASDDLKKDTEFVMAAVESNGYALEFALDDLENDREIVVEAVKKMVKFLRF